MNTIFEQMLQNYNIRSAYEQENAAKEIMQEIVLCGLSRAGFFKEAAFYGGTALRIFYGLDRFSEDLDFSLIFPNLDFDLAAYFPVLEKEVRAFGLNVSIQEKKKTKESNVQSAFLKGDTREHLLLFYGNDANGNIPHGQCIKIKFEVDIDPPPHAAFEYRYQLLPAPYQIRLYDAPSLFAGKLHAVLCRAWKNRVKGRDLYDYIFYLSRGIPVNLAHLGARLAQSGIPVADVPHTLNDVKCLLKNRFTQIDYRQAAQDVRPFIKDHAMLELWSAEFFGQITDQLSVQV
ncbi:MAG: nucleotidyl transferase AbiEii/AbiGii toxin family protein [Subdoligranulum sp.]|nr:nucleotidyl transferase AbiEii/AbiGii toxin family protein [Subdoligranulum sp.]